MNPRRTLVASALLASAVIAHAMSDMPYHGDGHIMVNTSDLEWGPIASMAPGAKFALLEGDLSKEVGAPPMNRPTAGRARP